MLNVVLYEPEIPPNTGNVIRLCANTGARLHLVGTLGFELEDARLRRAGLDYREFAAIDLHPDWSSCIEQLGDGQLWAFSTRGQKRYCDVAYRDGDALLFGPESRGLPPSLLRTRAADTVLRLPMVANSRSMNLSNTVAVALFEALRQLGFPGLV